MANRSPLSPRPASRISATTNSPWTSPMASCTTASTYRPGDLTWPTVAVGSGTASAGTLCVWSTYSPTSRDPGGIHKAIWGEFEDEDFSLPADKPLTVAAYSAGAVKTAYVEPVAVGDDFAEMPLLLEPRSTCRSRSRPPTGRPGASSRPALRGLLGLPHGHSPRGAGRITSQVEQAGHRPPSPRSVSVVNPAMQVVSTDRGSNGWSLLLPHAPAAIRRPLSDTP